MPKATRNNRSTTLRGVRVSMIYILTWLQKKDAEEFCFVLKRFFNRYRRIEILCLLLGDGRKHVVTC
jgi:hypothetical protein